MSKLFVRKLAWHGIKRYNFLKLNLFSNRLHQIDAKYYKIIYYTATISQITTEPKLFKTITPAELDKLLVG